jgi:hypothetical protein
MAVGIYEYLLQNFATSYTAGTLFLRHYTSTEADPSGRAV